MPSRSRLILAAAALGALVLLGAACSSSSGSGSSRDDTTGTTTPVLLAAGDVPAEPSAGCSVTPAVAPGTAKIPVTAADGEALYYLRHLPPTYDGAIPLPLVMDLHGWGADANNQAQTSMFGTLGDAKGFATVAPQAPGPERVWDATLGSTSLTYFGQVLDEVEQTVCVDQNRIFVDGFSQGAIMTSAVACQFAARVAAVATVAGITDTKGCDPSRPVPVIAFHGTADPFVGYDGYVGAATLSLKNPDGSGRTLAESGVDTHTKIGPAIPEVAAAWATRNGCDANPTNTPVPPDVTEIRYSCASGAEVVLYSIAGGGHAWPGSAFTTSIASIVGPTTETIDATALAWDFFAEHPRQS